MNELLERIEDTSLSALSSGEPPTPEKIRETVNAIAEVLAPKQFNSEDLEHVCRHIEARFDIRMKLGAAVSEPYEQWLDAAKVDITPYFWRRYQRYLKKAGYPPLLVDVDLDRVTDKILGYLENPNKPGNWKRKGLIVGHVQSGKTANYTGLICKTADAGYRLIIVMAGIHNNLRNQTQSRIDAGFIGIDSSKLLENVPLNEKRTGVGLQSGEFDRFPVSFTSSTQDFNSQFARQLGLQLSALREPVILVIKKNHNTLRNLISWLKNNNLDYGKELIDSPMLLIDDEADNASINTNKEFEEASTINRLIRQLLNSFNKRSFLAYTATPFANIFIDPETDDDMYGDDLFPRDFIVSLDPPNNYIGANRIFMDDFSSNIIEEVADFEDLLPLKHKKDWRPAELPSSLLDAIKIFILARAARILRGQDRSHNSMLINVSRFTGVQSHIKGLVHIFLEGLKQSIANHYALPVAEAVRDSTICSLRDAWEDVFKDAGHTWEDVQSKLHVAAAPIRVVEVNSSRNSEPLNYQDYSDGLNVIAVGGLSLSRGLTLEGLTVSYFLRNSIMYDTLMQMGRWFGYRDGYGDLCKVFLTAEAASWYSHIAESTEELREEFVRMEQLNLTPKDFGLAVRSHPDSLIVTARNKMRLGQSVVRSVSLEGRLVESTVLYNSEERLRQNRYAIERIVSAMGRQSYNKIGNHHFWRDVPVDAVRDFIQDFETHPVALLAQKKPLLDYMNKFYENEYLNCDVVLMSRGENESVSKDSICGLTVYPQIRTVLPLKDGKGWEVSGKKRRVASTGAERIGFDRDRSDVKEAEAPYKMQNQNVPDKVYRSLRSAPLLMLHLLDCRIHKDESPIASGVAAFGISFPGESGRKPENLVEYIVNPTWWDQNYGDDLDEEDEESE